LLLLLLLMRLKALVIDPQDGSLSLVETPWTTVELLAPVDTETKSANHREGDYPNVEQSHPCLGHPDADGGHTAPRPSLFDLAPPTPCTNRPRRLWRRRTAMPTLSTLIGAPQPRRHARHSLLPLVHSLHNINIGRIPLDFHLIPK
jgi:hypothetical protein